MGEGGIRCGDESDARRRLTVAQAADQLGVTVDAVRSRIKRGTIDYVRESGRVYVMLGTDQGETRRDQESAQHTDQPTGPDYRDELLEELRDRVRSLEAANRENRRIIAELTYRIPAIEPPETPGGPETAAEGTERVEGPDREAGSQEATDRRSWWRRVFGG